MLFIWLNEAVPKYWSEAIVIHHCLTIVEQVVSWFHFEISILFALKRFRRSMLNEFDFEKLIDSKMTSFQSEVWKNLRIENVAEF